MGSAANIPPARYHVGENCSASRCICKSFCTSSCATASPIQMASTSLQKFFGERRVHKLDGSPPIEMLRIQYRMAPSISAFPSSFFYGSRLVDGENVLNPQYSKAFVQDRCVLRSCFLPLTEPLVKRVFNSQFSMTARQYERVATFFYPSDPPPFHPFRNILFLVLRLNKTRETCNAGSASTIYNTTSRLQYLLLM